MRRLEYGPGPPNNQVMSITTLQHTTRFVVSCGWFVGRSWRDLATPNPVRLI